MEIKAFADRHIHADIAEQAGGTVGNSLSRFVAVAESKSSLPRMRRNLGEEDLL